MFDAALNDLYREVAESIGGENSKTVTPEDIQILAQMIQQIPQQIPIKNDDPWFQSIVGQLSTMAQQVRELNRRVVELENKEPDFTPVLDEMKKTKTKTVTFDVVADAYGFPEKVIAKEQIK